MKLIYRIKENNRPVTTYDKVFVYWLVFFVAVGCIVGAVLDRDPFSFCLGAVSILLGIGMAVYRCEKLIRHD